MPRSPTIDKFKRATAKHLRLNATDAEQRLWRYLKRLETRGTHFRRQMPIGNYVADFACPATKIIIEVDGSQHDEPSARTKDRARTAWLVSQGYRVLRFWNNDVAHNIEGVMETIYAALYGSRDTEPHAFKHERRSRDVGDSKVTPPRRAALADPPPPGEGEESA